MALRCLAHESFGALWTVDLHDRYKDLALVERDFRTLKTGHLEFRPWFVCTADNTQAHALTSMLALKVRRHLERAWWSLEVTVEEGLRELEKLCVLELVHPQSGKVVARQVPEPSQRPSFPALWKAANGPLWITIQGQSPDPAVFRRQRPPFVVTARPRLEVRMLTTSRRTGSAPRLPPAIPPVPWP